MRISTIIITTVITATIFMFTSVAGNAADSEPLLMGEKEGGIVTFTPEEKAVLKRARTQSRALAIIARRVRPAVVHVRVQRSEELPVHPLLQRLHRMDPLRFPLPKRTSIKTSQGSGVIVDARGYILTNHHVISHADIIAVRLTDGRQFRAELIGSDPQSDIAVLRISGDRLTVATMGDSDDIKVGDRVLAIGSPHGLESSVTSGIISAQGRSGVSGLEIEDFIQTDASINPGNSGGPLINLSGQVIGINTAIISEDGGSNGLNFTVPINIARTILHGLINEKKVTAGYLGAKFQYLTAAIAQSFGMESTRGALVTEVLRDTPAAAAGLRRGDIVVKYGKREIKNALQIRSLISTTELGGTVELEVVRLGKIVHLNAKVSALPEAIARARIGRKRLENLGVEETKLLTEQRRKQYGYEPLATGVLIVRVKRNSRAQQLGIMPRSLILSVNGVATNSPGELLITLGSANLDKGVELLWRTGNRVQRVLIRDH